MRTVQYRNVSEEEQEHVQCAEQDEDGGKDDMNCEGEDRSDVETTPTTERPIMDGKGEKYRKEAVRGCIIVTKARQLRIQICKSKKINYPLFVCAYIVVSKTRSLLHASDFLLPRYLWVHSYSPITLVAKGSSKYRCLTKTRATLWPVHKTRPQNK